MEHGRHIRNIPLKTEESLFALVENRSSFTLENCELNVFETYQKAERVNLMFGDLVLTSMIRGKKVMHLFNQEGFDYLPGESVIVPPNEVMKIDFPEARADNPTQCIALAIAGDQIVETVNLLNEQFPKAETHDAWHIDTSIFHLINNQDLADIINRLVRISTTDHTRQKDVLAGLALRELLVRLMQTQARQLFEMNYAKLASNHRFAHVIRFIKENLRERINLDTLHEKASMSRANFFRKFKAEFGYAPGEYILKERVKAARQYLHNPLVQVTEVCFMSGFQNLNYFIRIFKKETGLTPKAFQQQFILRD